ncbi:MULTISPECIES: SigE family RNA polymerase sigma factor [unclassified Modestobacter]|uniref:SigE family RNA polymerase sigma factor n=1 Tax=unclassified Modestobacter TaxID=2643866 RepID=UPI0022AA94EE|nr:MULTISPECIES: SigE family RNA polymerase sigma factor [unclassified Modestobacter]MCZ2811053.1 SigE family RNA polymerase sigma factor [Modestobacter sp. VKM Ac-2979]MCZ2840566.1 SigE family RNA polymerase sigma factor [Modestobacter sp. VKM Ac-2980]MCZ2847853.1 SigE family RNA polymerase sigma factor [Modestobacter sp. VKM Ac-2978]
MRAEHEAAFEAFVAARSHDLLRVGFLLTADRGHAEDLLQTALLKAYRHWGRISGEDAYPYVRKVLVTSAASWRRRRTTQEIVSLPAHDAPEPDQTDVFAERDVMATALAALPPRMRAVLVLRYGEDLGEAATAAALGCSVNTVKSQTTRGLARLRAVLADQLPMPAFEER